MVWQGDEPKQQFAHEEPGNKINRTDKISQVEQTRASLSSTSSLSPSSSPSDFLTRLRAQYSVPQEQSPDALEHLLSSPTWIERVAAVRRLGEIHDESVITQLAHAMQDEHEAVRAAAASTLGKHAAHAPMGLLLLALHDTSWQVRAAAAQTLGKLGKRVPIEPLLHGLQDDDASVRAAVVSALGANGNRTAIEPLLIMLQDSSWQVREMAVASLGSFGLLVPALELAPLLHDSDRQVREAVEALHDSQPALFAAILRARTKNNSEVRQECFRHVKDEQSSSGPTHSLQPLRVPRRAALTGLAALLVVGNGIAWTLLLQKNRLRSSVGSASNKPDDLYRTYDIPHGAFTVAWSPDSACIATAGINRAVEIRSAATGKVLLTYTRHTQAIFSIAWSPDGKYIASGGSDTSVQVWEAQTGQLVTLYGRHRSSIIDLAWSPDSTRILSSSQDGHVQVWAIDKPDGTPLRSYTGYASDRASVSWSPNGQFIAIAGLKQQLSIYQAVTNALLYQQKISLREQPAPGHSMYWSPVGNRLVLSNRHDHVQVISIPDGQVQVNYTPPVPKEPPASSSAPYHRTLGDTVDSIAGSPDGQLIATVLLDKTIYIWEAATGRTLFTYQSPSAYIFGIAWSPDGRYLAAVCKEEPVLVLFAVFSQL